VDPAQRYSTAAQVAFDLQHPEGVALTARATRLAGAGFAKTARRWLESLGGAQPAQGSVSDHLASAPIVMVAIDLMPGERVHTPLPPFGGGEQIAWSPDGKEMLPDTRQKLVAAMTSWAIPEHPTLPVSVAELAAPQPPAQRRRLRSRR
jgi:hypothetical protein